MTHVRNGLLSLTLALPAAGLGGCSDSGPNPIDGTQEEFDDLMEKMRAEEQASLEDRKQSD